MLPRIAKPAAGAAGAAGGSAPWALHPADRRQLLALLAITGASIALRLLTWNAVADGGLGRYSRAALISGCAAAVVWWLIRAQTGPARPAPLLASLAVLLSADAVHYVRLAHPAVRGQPVLALDVSFADEASARRRLAFESTGAGKALFEPGAVRLESPPNATSYMRLVVGTIPDPATNWWLPVGLTLAERTERLAWRASVVRTGEYYVVADVERLLIQVVSYGLHITYPDERGEARGHEIPHPAGSDGRPHEWQVTRDSRQIALSIDGRQVWSAPQRGGLSPIRLGETRADPQHGGSMRVEAVSYSSALERP